MLALALLLLAPAQGYADDARPRVTIAMLPQGTTVERIADAAPGISVGVLSAGLGEVPVGQTYLDISQGSRLGRSLYPDRLPPLYVTGNRVPGRFWSKVRERALEAPASIEPGLLATTLVQNGVRIAARPLAGQPSLIAVDEGGRVRRADSCLPGLCPGVSITSTGLRGLSRLMGTVREEKGDMLIALERPPTERELLSIGIYGAGFEDGDLTSATTRMDGYVLVTDLLPTLLTRYGIPVPEDEVTGREIDSTGGGADVAGIAELERRLGQISDRRWVVLAVNVMIWVAATLLAAVLWRRRGAALALVLLATTMAYTPAMLLIGAALEPSVLVERLIVGMGGPLAAGLSLLALRRPCGDLAPYGAFALAAAVSVGATAIDMIFGSPLTALSLLGPNPGLGVRFFGIGNELEATIGALLILGTGAGVATLRPSEPARAMVIASVVVTTVAVLIFAPGRLGADVGAAITFPAGAAGAVIAALGLGLRRSLLVLLAPLVALLVLVLVDLVSGGDAHLSRSVLGAGGSSELGDVFQRRITLGARSFPRFLDSPFFLAALGGIAAGVWFRATILSWVADLPPARAGLIGAATATLVGTLANDSAALLLMVGTGFIAAFCGLAWAARPVDR